MSEPVGVIVPQMNPNDESAVLVRWHVASGSKVRADQPVATLETTKVAFDVNAPCDGYIIFDLQPSATIAVGRAVAWISDVPSNSGIQTERSESSDGEEARFSRKALLLMKQYGLVPADFAGLTRVMTADVERVAKERSSRGDDVVPEDAEPLHQLPAKIIEVQALSEVYRNAVPSVVSLSISIARTNACLARHGESIGPVSLLEAVIHSVAQVLLDFPELNGFYDDGRAWHAKSVACGFAINIDRSLRVPVIRRTDELSMLDIAKAVRNLSLKYMRGELALEDLTGGTFTVTDLSGYDVSHFVPVLNRRQAAILGVCAERPGTGYRELVLSFDHRMTDGMQAAKFLQAVRDLLEGESPE